MTSQGTEVFVQTLLGEKVLPESWYNIVPDLSFELAPPLPPTFEAGVMFARTEVIIPAPEVTQAIKATVDLVLEAREERVILFNLCGPTATSTSRPKTYMAGELVDLKYSEEEIDRAVAHIPG